MLIVKCTTCSYNNALVFYSTSAVFVIWLTQRGWLTSKDSIKTAAQILQANKNSGKKKKKEKKDEVKAISGQQSKHNLLLLRGYNMTWNVNFKKKNSTQANSDAL